MSGSCTVLFETKKYEFGIYENNSGAYHTYRLFCNRKKGNVGIEIRGDSEWDDKIFSEFDKAHDELEKERNEKFYYKALTKEQLTLSELYRRMVQAESRAKYLTERLEKFEKLLKSIEELKE